MAARPTWGRATLFAGAPGVGRAPPPSTAGPPWRSRSALACRQPSPPFWRPCWTGVPAPGTRSS
eukprot:4332289-Lingulodinium_polyedra.AAC.1